MADEIAVDSFLILLRQSELLPDDQLLALTAEFEAAKPENSQKLADELIRRELLTTWQAEMLLQGKHRGFRLGPYRILKPLGHGGMSKVFLAEHMMMRRRCAIKVLPSKYQEDADLLNRFHLEARAIAALDHPNIVRAYDFNKDVRYGKEIHYLVMEYVEGPDLRQMVEAQGPLDYRKAADFICQAAEGLAHAHAAGFVHRDIKPANLLVDPHGVLKVLDLGLAMFTLEAERALNPSEAGQTAVGTADYIAPEQIVSGQNIDGRADIYSLGMTFYFLLTGCRPFPKSTVAELLAAHRTEKPEPIGKFRPDVPFDLDAIIDKMTAKSRRQRFQTAKEAAEKLRTWLSESGSARTYSRISALMAEATRGKQTAAQEPTRAAAEKAELELAIVDDGSPRTQEPPGTKTTDGKAVETSEAIPVEAKDKQRRPVVKNGLAPGKEKQQPSQTKDKPPRKKPESAGVQADLLSEYLAEDPMSALPPVEPLPAGAVNQGPLQSVPAPKPKEQRQLGHMLKSPWVLVGLAGLVLVIVVSLLVIFLSPSSTKEPGDHRVQEARAPVPDTGHAPPPSTPRTSDEKPVEPPKPTAPTSGGTPDSGIPRIEPPSPAPPKTPAPEAMAGKATTPPMVGPPVVATPPVMTPPVATPPVAVNRPMPANPPMANPPVGVGPNPLAGAPGQPAQPKPMEKAVNADELLAGLKTISVRLGKSVDSNPKSMLNQSIMAQAKGAARQIGIEVVEEGPNVLEVELTITNANDVFRVVLSAELKCAGPNGKGVTLWKKSEPMLSGDPKKMNPAQVMRVLKVNAGKFADKFFEQFSEDLKQVRAKTEDK